MQIAIGYDPSVTSLEASNPALYSKYTGAVNTAVQALEADFTNPVTLTINVGWGESAGNPLATQNGILAQNWSNGENVVSLAMAEALLTSNATTSAQEGFVTNLPSSLTGGATTVYVNEGEAAALGLIGPAEDIGSVGLSSAYPFTFSGNTIAAGTYDAVGVLEHEITQLMGRASLFAYGAYAPIDLTRFISDGVEDFGNSSVANHASDDGGTTNLGNFVTNPAEDLGDFSSSGNVFSGYAGSGETGVKLQITSNDITFMNLLGWDSSGGAPVSIAEINAVYNAVEGVTAANLDQQLSWLDNMSGLGDSGNINSVVDGTYVQTNIVPALDSFFLTARHYPTNATMQSQVNSGLTYTELVSADVGSQVWANNYNSGTLIDPNATLTAQTVNDMYENGLRHLPTQATLNGWLNVGYTQAGGFQEFLQSSTYALNNNANDDATLIGFANTALHGV